VHKTDDTLTRRGAIGTIGAGVAAAGIVTGLRPARAEAQPETAGSKEQAPPSSPRTPRTRLVQRGCL
jgi:hypothetical protein